MGLSSLTSEDIESTLVLMEILLEDIKAIIGSSFIDGSVIFSDGSTLAEDNSNLFWDNVNKRLGIGTTTPNNTLQVAGLINFDDTNFNVLLGTGAFDNDVGIQNIGIGYQAGYLNDTTGASTEGENNIYMGYQAGYGASGANNTGFNNVGIGYRALYDNTTGSRNFALGVSSMNNNTTGFDCVGLGTDTLAANFDGFRNIGIGHGALNQNYSGDHNIGIGFEALFYQQQGNYNVAIGSRSGGHGAGAVKTFDNGVFIGYQAGYNMGTSADNNTFVGYQAGFNQTTNSNLLIIDNQDRGSAAAEETDALIYGTFAAAPANQTIALNATTSTLDHYPVTNDTYYLGKNDDDTPFAWKGLILVDSMGSTVYRIEVVDGILTTTDLTD